MKQYFKHFAWLFILILLLAGVNLGIKGAGGGKAVGGERTNKECLTTQRVFDEADKLTELEEGWLEELIAQEEKKCGCDIVIVTIDDSSVGSLMNFADDFYDELKFGYNRPWGDGAVYVDNWANGKTWLSTSGRVEDKYSSSMIRSLVNDTCARTNANPYQAYSYLVTRLSAEMSGSKDVSQLRVYALLAPIIIAGLYLVINLLNNRGKKTTVATTYVENGRPDLRIKQDIFLHKHTTHRTIQSSSGGGGHHMSSGGHSHGGGGGHH